MSVSDTDDFLMFHNAGAFCCQLLNSILIFYDLIFFRSTHDPVVIIMYAFWMFGVLLGLTVTTAGGIMVNHYVSTNANYVVCSLCVPDIRSSSLPLLSMLLVFFISGSKDPGVKVKNKLSWSGASPIRWVLVIITMIIIVVIVISLSVLSSISPASLVCRCSICGHKLFILM